MKIMITQRINVNKHSRYNTLNLMLAKFKWPVQQNYWIISITKIYTNRNFYLWLLWKKLKIKNWVIIPTSNNYHNIHQVNINKTWHIDKKLCDETFDERTFPEV